jgi:predicted O-methyltransferase YrrM
LKYKKYFRKTSLKQKGVGDFFLNEIFIKKPKTFLEVGVFHGVTARNVCELLYEINGNDFNYVGLDLFEKSIENQNEVIPKTNFSNPFKRIYFRYIKRQDPYSKEAVEELLSKFKIDYVFLDGGHDYITVINDLNSCIDVIKNNGTILCDDYDLSYAPGVKKAIDEFVLKNNFHCNLLSNDRFAKIEKQ